MARKLAFVQYVHDTCCQAVRVRYRVLLDGPLHHPYLPSYSTTILSEPSKRLRATSLGTMTIL